VLAVSSLWFSNLHSDDRI